MLVGCGQNTRGIRLALGDSGLEGEQATAEAERLAFGRAVALARGILLAHLKGGPFRVVVGG